MANIRLGCTLGSVLLQVLAENAVIAGTLDIERPEDPIDLHPTELTVVVSDGSRRDYLWEIGSGANWVGYHVAMMLSLQRHLLSTPSSPVPGLLMFDQPSQVYFPQLSALATERLGADTDDVESLADKDEDIQAVRRIFEAVATEVARHDGALQAFVFDHAGPATWGGISSIYQAANWRGGDKLVPEEWVEAFPAG